MKAIMVIFFVTTIGGSGVSISSIHFATMQACENAKSDVERMTNVITKVRTVCVESGQ